MKRIRRSPCTDEKIVSGLKGRDWNNMCTYDIWRALDLGKYSARRARVVAETLGSMGYQKLKVGIVGPHGGRIPEMRWYQTARP